MTAAAACSRPFIRCIDIAAAAATAVAASARAAAHAAAAVISVRSGDCF